MVDKQVGFKEGGCVDNSDDPLRVAINVTKRNKEKTRGKYIIAAIAAVGIGLFLFC